MLTPSTPANEAARLKALEALNILDTPPEERFDRYTRLAQHILQTPIVLISLIDGQRQWFKSRQGLEATETPRDISFCGHAILDNELFCVYDAAADPRFADNPLVTGAPDIRFYAGAPLILNDGERVGTLCAIDRVPRSLSEEQRAALIDLSHCVADELQLQTTKEILAGREVQLQKSTEMVRSIIDTVVDGIITIDAHGNIQTVNPTAERLFDYSATEMVGQNVKMLMPEPFHQAHDGYLQSYISTGQKKIIGIGREVIGRRRDGSTFPMELAVGEMRVQGEPMFTGIIRDVSERNAARQALQESTDRLRLATQAAGMGVWEYDLGSRELVWDDRMFQIYGIKRENFANAFEAWNSCLTPEQLARADIELRAAIKGEKALQAEFDLVWPNGEVHVVEAAALVLRDYQGQAVRLVGVNIDISERKRMEQMKNEFVSTVSHELRTPLTSIKGALGLIRSGVTGELPEKLSSMLDIAYNNSDRLVRLINDILDIEKIEAGKMDFHKLPLDLVPLIEESLEANREYAKTHRVVYRFQTEIDAARVEGDHDRLIQAMTNLLSNAAKFSPQGGCVEIRLAQINNEFRVEVQDKGAGIPVAFRSKIFSKFSQADGSDTRQKGGTGLGLNITQAIIEQHLGKIGFEGGEGAGTTFYIELPCFRESDPEASTDAGSDFPDRSDSEALRNTSRQRRGEEVSIGSSECVLICEDEPDIAAVLQQILTEAHFEVDLAATAEEALRKLRTYDYAAMTLDLRLPDEDGMLLLKRLRSQTRNADIPVIVVSVLADTVAAQSSADDRALVSDWQQKPIDSQRLITALSKALLPGSSDRSRILHVEDDADICQVVARLLDGSVEVVTASTLLAARQHIHQDMFELILLDLTLPDGRGEELLRWLPFTRNINTPVVVFSARELSLYKPQAVQSALLKSKTDNDWLLKTIIAALRPC